VFLISEGHLIDIVDNPSSNFINQKVFVVLFDKYIYLVPYVKDKSGIFLKTIIPSRKATRKYLGDEK
jgi:hypothetical protein